MPTHERIVVGAPPKGPARPCCEFETTDKLCRRCRDFLCPEHICQCAHCGNWLCPDCIHPTLLPTVGRCRYGCPPGAEDAEKLRKKFNNLIEDADDIDEALAKYMEGVFVELKEKLRKLGLG